MDSVATAAGNTAKTANNQTHMAGIGPRKKHYKVNPPNVSKKRLPNDENLVTTPQPKRSRYGSTATTAMKPIVDSTSNTIDVNQMKNLLRDMSEELGQDFTSSFILSNVAQILKLAFDDLQEAISTLVNDHLGLVYVPATAVAVTPGVTTSQQSTKSTMAPASIAQETVVPVNSATRI